MDLHEALMTLTKLVKNAGTIDQRHLDLTLVPASDRELYEKALIRAQIAVKEGELTREELLSRLQLL